MGEAPSLSVCTPLYQPVNPVLSLNIFLWVLMLLDKGLAETLLMPQAYGDFDNLGHRREIGWADMETMVHPERPHWVCGER